MTKHNIISDNGTVRVKRFTKNDEGTIFYHVFVGRVQYGTVARVRPASGYAYLSVYMPDGPLVSTHTLPFTPMYMAVQKMVERIDSLLKDGSVVVDQRNDIVRYTDKALSLHTVRSW